MVRLVFRNLLKHPVRSLLTVASLTVALFLLCVLRSLVTTLEAGVESADSGRLWVQSAVSLFVDFPTTYQPKVESVPGVADTCKWQWLGCYYQDPSNWFAQFATDPEELLSMWPELEIIEGSRDAFLNDRTTCLIGERLQKTYGFEIGDTIPLIGGIYPPPPGEAWTFTVAGIYRPKKPSLDDQTLFCHWDYFSKTVEEQQGRAPNVGVIVIAAERDADVTRIMRTVDEMFENGPQVVQTTTEAEFNRQFVSMVGNLPRLVLFIGMGVFLAILLACVNTMLMAAREQVHDIGILKALGFRDGAMFSLLILQSMLLCVTGGGTGILLALASQAGVAEGMGKFFPGYRVAGGTLLEAVLITVSCGVLAGIVPALNARALAPVDALRRK